MLALVLAGLAAFAFTALGTRRVLSYLKAHRVLDLPNERSSHVVPTPRGGGLAVTPAVLVVWGALWLFGTLPFRSFVVVLLAGGLLVLSWRDDRVSLPASARLAAHLGAGVVGAALLPGDGLVFQGALPFLLDRVCTVLLWVWFLNLYNFMDGIDGITGVETASLGLGLALLAGTASEAAAPVALAGAALGFLLWNWHPAKIFLGDSGSIPLGFLLGWLLLSLAARGLWAPAAILPAYYLADAGITLARRLLRGEKVWQAHRQHFYQKAVQGGARHAWVARAILLADAGLILCALLAQAHPWAGIGLATLIVAALLAVLARRSRSTI